MSNVKMSNLLTAQEKLRRDQIAHSQSTINHLMKSVQALKKDCECRVMEQTPGGKAKCAVCGEYYGWWCPDDPSNVCDYEHEDGSYDEDNCRYCGMPDERK